MRIKDIVFEGREGSLQDDVADALPATFVIPDLQNQDPYRQYRFGVALAAARGSRSPDPNEKNFEPRSAWGENAVVVAYDNESELMIDQALAAVKGGSKRLISTPRSEEAKDINKTSAVAKTKRNRYGV